MGDETRTERDEGKTGDEAGERRPEETGTPADEKGKLTPEAQHALDERIGREVRKTKAAEEGREAAESELKTLKARLEGDLAATAEELGVLGEFVTADEQRAVADYRQFRRDLAWCKAHRRGYEGSGKAGDESMTEEEVERLRDRIEERLDGVADAAKGALAKARGGVRELLDLGRAAKKAGWGPGKATGKELRPPKLPGGGGSAEPRAVAGEPERGSGKPDMKRFMESGGGEDALLDVYKAAPRPRA
jgi:ElaB/YqjD/DUF883 family membrane-anchored ribosome-binding protein